MNTLLDDLAGRSNAGSESGRWVRITATPNPFTGERINVGVAAKGHDGQWRVRVMESMGRLECLYGEEGAENVLFVAALAKERLEQGGILDLPGVSLSEESVFFHMGADEAVAAFFSEQVPLATEEPKAGRQPSITSDTVRRQVYDHMRLKAGGLADLVIPQSPSALIEHDGKQRSVEVPLQHPQAFGALESAGYRSEQGLRLRLADALIDLEAAAQYRGVKRLGYFIARPTEMEPELMDRIDNAIDRMAWRMPKNCRFEVEDSTEALADKIIEWLPEAA